MEKNGEQAGKINVEKYQAWRATQTDDDMLQLLRDGKINRTHLAKACGFDRDRIRTNPKLKNLIEEDEAGLIERGVAPQMTPEAKGITGRAYDTTENRRLVDSRRLSALEQENIELKAKIEEMGGRLARFGELSETLSDMGMMPR